MARPSLKSPSFFVGVEKFYGGKVTKMKTNRLITTVDAHIGGEVSRVITGGVIDLPGKTMTDKLQFLNQEDDSFRAVALIRPQTLLFHQPAMMLILGSFRWRPMGVIQCPVPTQFVL